MFNIFEVFDVFNESFTFTEILRSIFIETNFQKLKKEIKFGQKTIGRYIIHHKEVFNIYNNIFDPMICTISILCI